ncbi:hypothetical protein BD410DRAFT_102131 [Rickenella mellea]|uniref:Uncharacterized protein n=1 Tax=Rickenella mellea TaxID=50990 RepID=A0A4Y7PKQ3_9AGAM|nr:hypothetical protein BD410DRAFT_102131 [Rickenella mellea]
MPGNLLFFEEFGIPQRSKTLLVFSSLGTQSSGALCDGGTNTKLPFISLTTGLNRSTSIFRVGLVILCEPLHHAVFEYSSLLDRCEHGRHGDGSN